MQEPYPSCQYLRDYFPFLMFAIESLSGAISESIEGNEMKLDIMIEGL